MLVKCIDLNIRVISRHSDGTLKGEYRYTDTDTDTDTIGVPPFLHFDRDREPPRSDAESLLNVSRHLFASRPETRSQRQD